MPKLRDYQNSALQVLNDHFLNYITALVVMATGLGKTYLAAAFANNQAKKSKGLFLCHDSSILQQARLTFDDFFTEDQKTTGLFYGQQKDMQEVNVLFATFQTMREWKEVFFAHEFDYIIVDEGHHSGADTYKDVIKYFKPKYLLGMTATPDREDQEDIRGIFGPEVIDLTLEESIVDGLLVPFEYHVFNSNLNTSALRRLTKAIVKESKRVSIKQLNETIFIKKNDREIAKIIQQYGDRAIIFCESIEHIENFKQYLPQTRTFHSKNSSTDNQQALKDFKAGRVKYILARDKFNEGIDVPDVELVVFLRATNSKRIFLQQLGRGLRPFFNKTKLIVLDFVANCDRIVYLDELAQDLQRRQKLMLKENKQRKKLSKQKIHITGNSFSFHFTHEIRNALELIRKVQMKTYIADIPDLLVEYSDRNKLPPDQVIAGTGKKVWWKCSKCGYEWQTSGHSRVQGWSRCKECILKEKSMAVTHPELAKELMEKESGVKATEIMAGTKKELWWKCSKCGHKWQTTGGNRVQGWRKCQKCADEKFTKEKSMAATHPELAKELMEKESGVKATEIVAGDEKELWWKCSVCGHKWQATGKNRIRSNGCKKCAIKGKSIVDTHPELAKELMEEKSGVKAMEISARTIKPLWWKCNVCGCEWKATGHNRVYGWGKCRECILKGKSMADTHSELAKELIEEKSGVKATEIVAGTHKKLWWKCGVCGYEWQTSGDYRAQGGGKCKQCADERKKKKKKKK